MRTTITLLASLALVHAGELHQAARVCDGGSHAVVTFAAPVVERNGRERNDTATHRNRLTPEACVGLLLEAGADRKVRDRQDRTAFDAARKIADVRERATILLYLTWNSGQKIPQDRTAPMPWSLEHSVMHRQTNVTKMLLAMGADPNAIGTGGTTPLADAALKGDLMVFACYLRTARGQTP